MAPPPEKSFRKPCQNSEFCGNWGKKAMIYFLAINHHPLTDSVSQPIHSCDPSIWASTIFPWFPSTPLHHHSQHTDIHTLFLFFYFCHSSIPSPFYQSIYQSNMSFSPLFLYLCPQPEAALTTRWAVIIWHQIVTFHCLLAWTCLDTNTHMKKCISYFGPKVVFTVDQWW